MNTIRKVKILLVGLLFIILGFQTSTLAVSSCGGFYSPNNPFPCSGGGNCVWWTFHWLRYGKGHRNLTDTKVNKFKRSALYWDDDAISMGMTVDGNLEKGAIAVNETQKVGSTVTGHAAVLVDWDSEYLYVDEMIWGSYGLTQRKKYRRSNNYFKKFIHPFPQPKLSSILPSLIYKANYDQNFILNGENLDRVTKLELTFPNNGGGTLSGSQQLLWKNYNQLGFLAAFRTSGRYVINAVTDKNVESIPRMPFDVY